MGDWVAQMLMSAAEEIEARIRIQELRPGSRRHVLGLEHVGANTALPREIPLTPPPKKKQIREVHMVSEWPRRHTNV